MNLGSVQTVVVCVPVADAACATQQAVCPAVNGQFFAPGNVQAYVLDPSQQNNIEASIGPFDYVYAAGLWSLAFSMVVGLYCVSLGIGSVLDMIRRG